MQEQLPRTFAFRAYREVSTACLWRNPHLRVNPYSKAQMIYQASFDYLTNWRISGGYTSFSDTP